MTQAQHHNPKHSGHRIFLIGILCLFGLYAVLAATPRKKRTTQAVDERIHLVHADELRYEQRMGQQAPQVLNGKVHFSHAGSHLWCDSAYFFQESNSVQAFGKVVFKQGDTLSLTCRYADYDGQKQLMRARYNVVLTHRTQVLHTDSLDYDRIYGDAYFFEGGRLTDGQDRLSSDWGNYNTGSRMATFYYRVKMHTPTQEVVTDTLFYDTRERLAHVSGPSTITSKDQVVHTTDAYLNSATDQSQLFGRSTIESGDKRITGDSLYHNSATGANEGFGHVVYEDAQNRNALYCDHLEYNDKTGRGFATDSALVVDFSQKDTLYLHADSFHIYTYNIETDSVYRIVHAYPHVRAYRADIQAVCDSLVYNSADSCMTMYRDPIVWNANRQLLGEVIRMYNNDSTIRYAEIEGQALSVEQLDTKNHYNQLSSRIMKAFFTDGALRRTESIGNVKSIYYFSDDKDSTLTEHNYLEGDTLRAFLSADRRLEKLWTSRATGTISPITQIAGGRVRLPEFAWFDQIRPLSKDDIFVWRGKNEGEKLKEIPRQEAPLQHLSQPAKPSEP